MKKSGFTLIELLAVIVILAVIALIATPMIMDVIEKSRRGAAIESVNGILDTAEKYQLESMLEGIDYPTTIDLTSDVLTYKGAKPESGTLIIEENGKMSILAKYGKYCIQKNYSDESPKVVEDSACENGIQIIYKESLLNGADPVLKEGLTPIMIDNNGIVRKADISQEWYNYNNKEWANAVILKDESTVYHNGEVIPEEKIESYFVWIPKYSYQLWDLGEYGKPTNEDKIDESKVHTIPIKFGLTNTSDAKEGECTTSGVSGESGNCEVGDYMTHPAFLAFDTNGLWVGKFETGYEGATTTEEAQVNEADATKLIIKPNVYSWRNITVGNAFKTGYEYRREYESHMMKNTEWGAVAYLSHSQYGVDQKIRLNNNSSFITGYASIKAPTLGAPDSDSDMVEANAYELTLLGEDGTYTINYFNPSSVVASTTGNYTGIYDMSGGAYDFTMGYNLQAAINGDASLITDIYSDFFTDSKWNKYYDTYITGAYFNRILGDATGEMGPYEIEKTEAYTRNISSWYRTYFNWSTSNYAWYRRGGRFSHGTGAGIFGSMGVNGSPAGMSYRIVLSI